jgi:glutamate-1-semialdehyde aminotransferase
MQIDRLMSESGVAFGTSGARGLVADMTDRVCYAYTAGFLQYLLGEGVLLPQCPNQTAYVSAAHGAKDIDETLSACEEVLLRFHQEDLP